MELDPSLTRSIKAFKRLNLHGPTWFSLMNKPVAQDGLNKGQGITLTQSFPQAPPALLSSLSLQSACRHHMAGQVLL